MTWISVWLVESGFFGDEVQLSHMHSSCWSSRDFPNQAKPEAGYSSKGDTVGSTASWINQAISQASKQASKGSGREKLKVPQSQRKPQKGKKEDSHEQKSER